MAAVKKPGTPLQRYFRLLEVVAGFPAGVTLAQLVGLLGLPKTTVHRLLRGLTEVGALTEGPGGTYRLGPRFSRSSPPSGGAVSPPASARMWTASPASPVRFPSRASR